MITIRPVADLDYYRLADHQADDLHTYLAEGDAIVNSRWLGTAAERYELSGPVTVEQFKRIAAGLDPHTGSPLLPNRDAKYPALDITVSAGKDLSVMWALTPAARPQIEDAVRTAAASTIRALELDTAVVRRGHDGLHTERADGLVAATFFHHTSRLGDPQLHIHMVVPNLGTGPDGRTTALHLRRFYNDRAYAEAVFQSTLRHELATTLGYTFATPDRFNYAPIVGVPDEVQRTFSKRHTQIHDALEQRGLGASGQAARVAAVTTRPDKDLSVGIDELTARWKTEAAELGWSPTRVLTMVRDPSTRIDHDEAGRLATERTATYRRQQAVIAVARTLPSGASLDQLIGCTDEYLSSTTAVVRAEQRWTTREILALETAAINAAETARGRHQQFLTADATTTLLDAHPTLGADQRRFVAAILQSNDGVQVAVAPPGTGKTFSTAIVVEAVQPEHRLFAVAPSARAANEIRKATGLHAVTTATLIGQLDRGEIRFGPRDLLIADEFGMQATREGSRLITATQAAGARMLIVGDPKQLPEIEAGGLLGALTKRLPVVTLTENRRQRDLEEQHALDDLRTGAVDDALQRYQRNGNLTLADDPAVLRDQLVADWFNNADGTNPTRSGLMVAATRHGVHDLNLRARTVLADHGLLGRPLATIGNLELNLGDRVVALHNRYDLGIHNGDFATITDANQSSVRIRLDNGVTRVLPASYVLGGHLDHGYATTVHKAQGATCDRLYFLGDDALYAELGYTALSRGRNHNHLYALNADVDAERLDPADDPLDSVRRALKTSRAQTAAVDLDPAHSAGAERDAADRRRQLFELYEPAVPDQLAPKRKTQRQQQNQTLDL